MHDKVTLIADIGKSQSEETKVTLEGVLGCVQTYNPDRRKGVGQ